MRKEYLNLILICYLISIAAIGVFAIFNLQAISLIIVLLVLICPIGLLLIAKISDRDFDKAFKRTSSVKEKVRDGKLGLVK
ncbi:MAG: hypothetical protein GTO18_17875 [Anaerolineales bacterium]|nr:hypothetical protein [Anaerolineales bacterium]